MAAHDIRLANTGPNQQNAKNQIVNKISRNLKWRQGVNLRLAQKICWDLTGSTMQKKLCRPIYILEYGVRTSILLLTGLNLGKYTLAG